MSRGLERPNRKVRTRTGSCERGGRGPGIEVGTTGRAQVSTGIDMPGNPEKQCQGEPSPTMHTGTATTTDIAAPLDTTNDASSSEETWSEVYAEQVQTDRPP